MANAVGAVTAGFNQVAQARAAQWAREQEMAKAKLAREEQFRKNIDTNSVIAQRGAQAKRWEDMSANEQQKYGFDREKFNADQQQRRMDDYHKTTREGIDQQNADSLKASREASAQHAKDELDHYKERHKLDREQFEEAKSQFDRKLITEEQYRAKQQSLAASRVGLAAKALEYQMTKGDKVELLPYLKEAADNVNAQESRRQRSDWNAKPISDVELNKRITASAAELMKADMEARAAAKGTGVVKPPPAGATTTPPSAISSTDFGPSDQAEGRTGTINGKPVITKGGKWVAR
jgi:hypothetical protein